MLYNNQSLFNFVTTGFVPFKLCNFDAELVNSFHIINKNHSFLISMMLVFLMTGWANEFSASPPSSFDFSSLPFVFDFSFCLFAWVKL